MSLPSSGWKISRTINQHASSSLGYLAVCLATFFLPEDGSDIFLRIMVSYIDYTVLYPRKGLLSELRLKKKNLSP
jgi:hypothetical protein